MLRRFLRSLKGNGETDKNVTHCIGVGWLNWRASGFLYVKKVSPKLKGKFYRVAIHPALLYEAECWPGEERDYSGEGEGGFGGEQDARSAVILVQHVMRRGSDIPVRKCETLAIDGFRRGRDLKDWIFSGESNNRKGHEYNLAWRKAKETALKRYQATHWLECFIGPLGISSQPSEREFVSCLRSVFVLCNLINKVQPGSVPKVVEIHTPSQSTMWDSQPLPAYQYFENIQNFLVAAEDLKLPAFEGSIFERAGSSTKVVDCILELKAYHEWKQMTGGVGCYKPLRSPLLTPSRGRIQEQTHVTINSDSHRRLEMSASFPKQSPTDEEIKKLEGLYNDGQTCLLFLHISQLVFHFLSTLKFIQQSLVYSRFFSPKQNQVELFSRIFSSCLEEQLQNNLPSSNSIHALLFLIREQQQQQQHTQSQKYTAKRDNTLLANTKNKTTTREYYKLSIRNHKHHQNTTNKKLQTCIKKGKCNHWTLVVMQEKELSNLKVLLASTKREFENLQSQLQSDLKQLGDQVLDMSNAALGYHKVMKENRTLHNMVQDLKGNIRVYCRIRPAFDAEAKTVVDFIGEDGSLVVIDPLKPWKDGRKIFEFNRVFGSSATQEDVFRDTKPLVRSVMDGYNVCIFAYGQTGSGKTYTMSGPGGESTKEFGINQLALNDLFLLSDERKDIMSYKIHVQMVEIYNEQIRDLLADDPLLTKYPFIVIFPCMNGNGLPLPDASVHPVNCARDVIDLMKLGDGNRAVGSTAMNNRSSRSHSVLTVHVHGEDTSGNIIHSCLHLVDLAGSERVDKSEVTGDGLKEAQHINKSLSCLGDVITALAQKNSHIPYRNSKLTLLLQNSLGGHAKTLMFAHVSPEGDSFGETISTLKFAQRVSSVELGAAHLNKENVEVLDLKAEIETLKKALANKEALTPQTNKPKEASRTPFQKPKATAELQEGYDVTKLYDQAGNDSFMKTPPSPPFAFRSQDTPQTPASGLKYQQAPRSPTSGFKSQQPPRSPTSGFKSQQPPRSPTSGFKSQQPPRSPTSGFKSQQHPRSPTSGFKSKQAPRSPTSTYKSQQAPRSPTSALKGCNAPRSPTSAAIKSQVVKTTDNRTRIPSLQLPKTPEPLITSISENKAGMQSNRTISSEFQKPLTSSTHGKGSQIRRSLRTIGKLINGSDRKNQQKRTEAAAPLSPFSCQNEEKSSTASNARTLRRQSLTGIPLPTMSRRSSLGGGSVPDSCANESRNCKTPGASAKLTKRWL
ncbi:Kinesin KP1 [Capsicum chinense]|nr:Kinesin KP1 [Capsicum chinense]